MKGHSGTYRKGSGTLPLEGGGRRVGVKELGDVAPLTRPLSPKGRGKIPFDITTA